MVPPEAADQGPERRRRSLPHLRDLPGILTVEQPEQYPARDADRALRRDRGGPAMQAGEHGQQQRRNHGAKRHRRLPEAGRQPALPGREPAQDGPRAARLHRGVEGAQHQQQREQGRVARRKAGGDQGWREVFVGGGVASVGAAAAAGLAVAALARRVAPAGTADVAERLGLPPLPSRDVVLHANVTDAGARAALGRLVGALRASVPALAVA